MKKTTMLILALSISINFLFANDESDITEAVKLHWEYSNNKEWDSYAKSMHSKGTLNGDSNGSFWYMQESTVSAVSQGLSTDDEQIFTPKYIEVEILEKGKVALAYYYLVGSYSINGVQKNDYRTRVSQVFLKEKGKWKVKSGHFTPLHSGSGIPN